MTLLLEPPAPAPAPEPTPPAAAAQQPTRRQLVLPRPTGKQVTGAVSLGAAILLAAFLVVELLLGAVLQQRSQSDLLHQFQKSLVLTQQRAAAASGAASRATSCAGLVSGCGANTGTTTQTAAALDPLDRTLLAPPIGEPVALLSIDRLGLSQVVVEGARAHQTQEGPGHVPGTALPGQPGNAGIVGRRSTFGAVFRHLNQLANGDDIAVATFQGVSHYRVTGVGRAGAADPFSYAGDNRLTLSTSDPALFGGNQLIVTAQLVGAAHAPSPQGVRMLDEDGMHASASALPLVIVLIQLLALAAAATLVAYRKLRGRVAWLLTTPVLLALALVAAEAADQLLPPSL